MRHLPIKWNLTWAVNILYTAWLQGQSQNYSSLWNTEWKTLSLTHHSPHGSQTVKTVLRGRPSSHHQERQEGTAGAPSQSLHTHPRDKRKTGSFLEAVLEETEKNQNIWSSAGNDFTQTWTLCIFTFASFCCTVVSWKKKVVMWGQTG